MNRFLKGGLIAAGVVVGGALVLPLIIPIPPLQDTVPPEQLADPDSQFVEVNGIKVHYKQVGKGEPVFILLHGFGAGLFSWQPVMEPLSHLGTVVAYDRPGFGLTSRPMPGDWQGESPYGPHAQVEMLVGLMDRLGIERAILVGHSAGGTIAALAALEKPSRVQALVLEDPALGSGGPIPSWAALLLRTPQMDRLGPLVARQLAGRGEDILKSAWHDPSRLTPTTVAAYKKVLHAENWDRALWQFTLAAEPLELSARLSEIGARTLIITGDDDRIVSTAATIALAPHFRNGRLVVIPNAGHLPHEETPEEFIKAVDEFAH